MATITFNQVGLPPGTTDRARSDGLATGAAVTITVSPGGGTLQFVDVPAADITAVPSLAGGPTSWTFTPTSAVYGTWLVQYTESGSTVRRSFAIRTPNRQLRIPAFNERSSIDATVANGNSHVADSDSNESDQYRGWAPSLVQLYQEVESGLPNSHAGTHRHGGSDEIANTVPTPNAIPKANSAGKLASGWTSFAQLALTGPTTSSPAVNTVVFCDVSAGTVTLNLPTTHAVGDAFIVKLASVATNTATIDPDGSQTVDGGPTLTLTNDYEWAWLISDGQNWFQIS